MPMIRSTVKNCGRIFSKDFYAFFSAIFVFLRLLNKEMPSPTAAAQYRIIVNISHPRNLSEAPAVMTDVSLVV